MNTPPPRKFAVIGAPSSAGGRRTGQERGPSALRAAGLVSALRDRGLDLVDHGDLPTLVFTPDATNPKRQNAALVAAAARAVAAAVARASTEGSFPVVLGGDCTITIGVLAALVGTTSRLGLLYFDGDLDLNTPETTPSGIFDGMVTAHIFGRGEPQLARLGSRCPLVHEDDLVYFGYNVAGGGIDPEELSALARGHALHFSIETIRANPVETALEARAALERRVERILVHFDVDVTDTPAVDVPHANGLALATAVEILKVFLASPKCVGLVMTEFNPEADADHSVARHLVALLAEALSTPLNRHD